MFNMILFTLFSIGVYPLNRDKRQAQVSNAVEDAVQSGLVNDGAVENGCAIAFVDKGHTLKPIGPSVIKVFLYFYLIDCVGGFFCLSAIRPSVFVTVFV